MSDSNMVPEVGSTAPDFTLPGTAGQTVTLSELRGTPVLLVFYPHAFTGRCTDELCELRDNIELFEADGVQLYGISADPLPALKVFHEQQQYRFPLLTDYWPHGEVSRSYRVFDEENGTAVRGSFLIDEEGRIRWSVVNPRTQVRALAEYRQALADLKSGAAQ